MKDYPQLADGFAEQRDLVVKEKSKHNHSIISLGYCRETEPEAGVRQGTYALCKLFFFVILNIFIS